MIKNTKQERKVGVEKMVEEVRSKEKNSAEVRREGEEGKITNVMHPPALSFYIYIYMRYLSSPLNTKLL